MLIRILSRPAPKALAVVLTLFASDVVLMADETRNETAELSFEIYSSSYLPTKEGHLTETNGEIPTDLENLLSKGLVEDTVHSSVMNRFDDARSSELGFSDKLEKKVKKSHYKKGALYWEGFCDRWAAAALNKQVTTLLASNNGLICGETFISKAEIKEMISAFYLYEVKDWNGDRTYDDLDKSMIELRDRLGLDDFYAHDFEELVFKYIRNDEGLILDLDSQEEVWNQPVFKASAVGKILDPGKILGKPGRLDRKFLKLISKLPSYLLKNSVPETKGLIDALKGIDQELLKQAAGTKRSDSAINKHFDHLRWKALKAIGNYNAEYANQTNGLFRSKKNGKEIWIFDLSLLEIRDTLWTGFVLPSLRKGKISYKEEYQIEEVVTRIQYGDEIEFAGHEAWDDELGDFVFADPHAVNSDMKEYQYLLIKRMAESGRWATVDSTWITKFKDRPDEMWVPLQQDIYHIKNADTNSLALYDLISLVEQCVDASTVIAFFESLDSAVSDHLITKKELSILQASFKPLAKVISLEEVEKRLEKADGMKIEDLLSEL